MASHVTYSHLGVVFAGLTLGSSTVYVKLLKKRNSLHINKIWPADSALKTLRLGSLFLYTCLVPCIKQPIRVIQPISMWQY